MAKSAVLKQSEGFLSTLPVGVIIAWHRDLDPTHKPFLPPGWVECNGQTLNDTDSPFHGQLIPNLNADPKGANSPGLSRKEQMFLRGGAVSGQGQEDQIQSHTHTDPGHTHLDKGHSHTDKGHEHEFNYRNIPGGIGGPDVMSLFGTSYSGHKGYAQIQPANADIQPGYADLGDPSDSRHGAETRPANMSVVWIMKVKQTVAARATPSVQAAENAPHGALYINQAGNVGVGTSSLGNARLEVAGKLKVSSGNLSNTGSGLHFGNDDSGFKWIQSFDSKPLCINPLGNNLILNRDGGNVGIGTANPQAKLHVVGDLLGAARDVAGNALRICCGQTPEGATNWQSNGSSGIYIDVDISLCGFKSTPIYIVNMHGNGHNWETTGGSSAYERAQRSFRVYVKFPDNREFTPAFANDKGWHIQWIAIGT